ncbi:hypothetical protein Tco_0768957 [Tanacetum coccineum]|uniref:Uncharacterized protein n=1 Tax=Tanacetum coccineum TaxID=301880 RepID=A0ABQ4Z9S2_9ASTR
MLQRFNMPTQTIPMLFKKPKAATADLHKDILGTRNPGLGYMAMRAQPALYDADTFLHPTHHPVSIWDSEEVLVHQVVSMKNMNEKPGHVQPENGFYDKLNSLMFVPQQELSREQAYWLPANEIASQASNPDRPVTPCIHTRPPPSQVFGILRILMLLFFNLKCQDTCSASNAIFEINKLRQQLQGKDDTIRNLDAQINIMKVLNVGTTEVYKTESEKKVDELSKANNLLTYCVHCKLSAFTAENTKLKAQVTGTTSSGPSTFETPKVLASGMYTTSSKYIPPPKRANWDKEPIVEPLELTPSVSSSSKVTMISRFTDCKLSDRKAGSKGLSVHPTDRSDLNHEEFADELAHIISPPEYDHFCFKIEPELGNLTMDVVNDIFPTREPRVHVPNVLSTHSNLDTDFILLSEPLFAYMYGIFLPFLTYPVALPYLLSCGNEDIIFDPGISIYHSFMPDVSHRSGT